MNTAFSSSRICGLARVCLALLTLTIPAKAQRDAKIPDPDPEIERKSFIVAPGFEVNLFAADPMLAKPIQMNWDARGRLWLATSETYPQIKPGQTPNDKIIILEDTNNDGVADKTEVFADGLLIPTAVLPGDGGAYVANSTEIIHLSQSKPGIKADKKRVVLSGFGTEDTHHLIHTFRWGPDGAMYFNQSVYIHSHVETPHGTKRLNGGGIWRYEPRTQKLEVFARGFWNPWGLQFDKYGQMFATDGANGEGIVHVIPGASYPTGGNQAPRVLHGMNPGSPKFCGLEIVSGRHFPDDWQGDCITNDFRGHRVCRFKLRDAGSTFESREMTEVIKSNHPAFRPIDVSIGPDGALYIADWYNPIIQHGEVDFRDPRRDKTHGRIWRVTAKGRPLVERPKLANATFEQLIEASKAPEAWTRSMVRRQFAESSSENVAYRLFKLTPAQDDHSLLEYFLINANAGVSHAPMMAALFEMKDERYRATIPQLLTNLMRTEKSLQRDLVEEDLLQKLLTDASPRFRLGMLRALTVDPSAATAAAALKVLDKPTDPTLEYALWLTLRELQNHWIPAFKEGKFDYGNDIKKLSFALEAVQSPETIPALSQLIAKNANTPHRPALQLLMAKMGGSEELAEMIEGIDRDPITERLALMTAIEQSIASRRLPKPKTAVDVRLRVQALLKPSNESQEAIDRLLVKIAGHWKLTGLRPDLEQLAVATSGANREVAVSALAEFGDAESKVKLTEWATQAQEPILRILAIKALASIDLSRAAKLTTSLFVEGGSEESAALLINEFVNRKNGAAILAKALESKTIRSDLAKVGLRAVRNSPNPSPALTEALTKAGSLGAAKKEPTAAEIKALAVDALKLGDAARGELVYRRKEIQCMACHAINGAGGQVGPDLTSIGASAQTDYLVDSLLLPNKAIKEGYHTVDVTTAAGRIHSGVKVREAGGELVLRDKDDKEITLKLDDIETRRAGRTLMPDGTVESLTRAELLDLVRFLGELGKVGAYEPGKAPLVRTWRMAEATPENMNLFRRERVGVAAEKPAAVTWSAAYSRVNGELPLADVATVTTFKGVAPQSVMQFKIAVSSAGDLKLAVNSPDGLAAYIDGTAVALDKPIPVTVGDKVVTLIVNREKRQTALRMTLDDSGTARARIVGGK